MSVELYNEDCKETMQRIPDGSIDLMLTDIPYGTTACEWDILPNLAEMWLEWERILKPYGTWIFTATQPISSEIINCRKGFFKYSMVWDKQISGGMAYANVRPMQQHEDIILMSRASCANGAKNNMTFNPQKTKRDKPIKAGGLTESLSTRRSSDWVALKKTYDEKNPTTIIPFLKVRNGSVHPTQKPVDLFRYLIKTYSNEGETVYDGYSGSGTTAIACIMEKRNFIGAELNKEYYEAAQKRINAKLSTPALF